MNYYIILKSLVLKFLSWREIEREGREIGPSKTSTEKAFETLVSVT